MKPKKRAREWWTILWSGDRGRYTLALYAYDRKFDATSQFNRLKEVYPDNFYELIKVREVKK